MSTIAAVGFTVLTIVGMSFGQKVVDLWGSYTELRADEITRSQQHFYDLAEVAFRAARSRSLVGVERGRAAAAELSREMSSIPDWDTTKGNALHDLHIVMGRLALAAGDIEAARSHLLEAGKTPGSPQLDNFGPDMTLAQELLERGERDTVLKYFDECGKFWRHTEYNRLSEWSAAVRAGNMPDFGRSSGLTPRVHSSSPGA